VRDPRRPGSVVKETLDEAEMEAEEGRSRAIELDLLPEEFDDESPPQEEDQSEVAQQPKELLRGRRFSRRS
jgi:hypothetical protein